MAGKLDARGFGWIAACAAGLGILAVFLRRPGWVKFGFTTMVAAGEKWRELRQAERIRTLISRPD